MGTATMEKLKEGAVSGDLPAGLPMLPSLATNAQRTLVQALLADGQTHLFDNWHLGENEESKLMFLNQVEKLNANYPGGLMAYIHNARRLLADSKAGKNPFDGYTPSVPTGERLTFGDKEFMKFEEAGVKNACRAAFVLVAGGLGERLGYSGIKIALPSQMTTEVCFLEHYIQNILALQEAGGSSGEQIPLVIMTSDDTHYKTQELLETNKYFGMLPDQIQLLKQEKVACLVDNDAKLALDPSNPFLIQTKPHGHGDVHALLHSSGLLPKWQQEGRMWVLFFQDTNGLLFKGIPSALGVSVLRDLDVNSLAVPRKAKEAIGGIAKLTHLNGSEMVINVEYNQLDPLLRATGHADGDVNDETGYSPYPGNINQLVLKLGPYMEELSRTKGAITEFVNPKYKDASKTLFKSSTRLECMMQDYPRTLAPSAKVGFTVLDTWLAYAPVKNNAEDAMKIPEGNPKHSPTSGEIAIYKANCLILQKAGAVISEPKHEVYNGQTVEVWPRIVWSPSWAITFAEVCEKLSRPMCISQRSTLVLNGKHITLEDISLDGTILVHSIQKAQVRLSQLRVENAGWELKSVDNKDENYPEVTRMRGFRIEKVDQCSAVFDKGGACCISNVSL